jgi:hypothetical protein
MAEVGIAVDTNMQLFDDEELKQDWSGFKLR